MPACKCKRGKCLVCGSSCKRCGCACDGVHPDAALARKNGQRGRALQYARPRKRNAATSSESQVAKKPCRDKPLETLNDVFAAFGFTSNQKANLPSRNDRQQGAVSDGQLNVLVRLLADAAKAVADILLPGDAQRLFTAMCIKEAHLAGPTDQAASKDLKNLSTAAATILVAAPRRSIQRRVARAILTKGTSRQLRRELAIQFDNKISLIAGPSSSRAYKDYETMVSGKVLETANRSLSRVPEQKIHSAIKFILASSNTCALPWGTKAVRLLRRETITLPPLVRRMQLKDLYELYTATESSDSRLGQTTFNKIAGSITQQNPALLSAVDYVTGTLVHDSLEVLQDIVDMFTSSTEDKENFTNWLDIMRNFVKVQYDRHAVLEDDNVPTHGLRHALKKPADDEDCASQDGHCDACAFVPWCFNQVRQLVDRWDSDRGESAINVDVDDAKAVIDDVEHKIELYQGHRVRVVNQQSAIAKIEEDIRRKVPEGGCSDTVILIMDYKMKFEERSARETMVQHFGKRGMSWHGCSIAFFTREGLKPGQPAKRMDVYLDQIVEGTNAQNVGTVIALLEAAQTWISANLPFANKIVLQTDNAKCYQSNELRLLIGLLNRRSPIKVVRFVYSETQDGKSKFSASVCCRI